VVTSIRPGHTYGEGGNNLLHALGLGTYHMDRLKKGQPIIDARRVASRVLPIRPALNPRS
jgi:hypothetical protein